VDEQHTDTIDPSHLSAAPMPVRVVVVSGPDAGKALEVRDGTVLVGSHADCQLQLTDGAVSRRHLSLELLGTRVRVRDLGSKNGTRYLGARISSVDVPLGASLELGGTTLALLPQLRAGALSDKQALAGLVGRAPATRRLFAQLEQLAPTDATVLLTGETGSGKDAVARALHALSPRAAGPFVAFDCGASSTSLIQAVLFGHVRGAFTGAVKDAPGVVEAADGGVLLLDEVSALPLDVQPVLLRVLETRTFTRVGDGKPRRSDFRLLASTTADLQALVKQGRFRSDLYYRLSAITLAVPPLRDRLDDVPLLAQAFAEAAGAKAPLSPTALSALSAWRWPGNVRELKNAVERVVTLGEEALHPDAAGGAGAQDFHAARELALKAFEKSYLEALLQKHRGSASAVAREAGIARSYLYKLLDAHGLAPESFRHG
jgi:DNA-binding NtrC family response regulator